jgi:predicted transcriptional regulator
MKTPSELRSKRLTANISTTRLAAHARINRSRLSQIEHGHIRPTEAEMLRMERGIDELIRAREAVEEIGAAVGWPLGAISATTAAKNRRPACL